MYGAPVRSQQRGRARTSILLEASFVNPVIKKFRYGNHTVTLETGRVARQATGAVLATMDDTVVLATVVGERTAKQLRRW